MQLPPMPPQKLARILVGDVPVQTPSIIARPPGMLAEPNINLNERTRWPNPDGSFSTVRSMSFGTPEGEVLVPTVREDGWYMSPKQARTHYMQTGKHLGVFSSPQEANAYAKRISAFQGE
ncbi:MAG: hypothetical protein L0287_37580 [Anaerolineae bacterium]|nr:hypothetical protein [Anaerolineae bacterium]